MTVAENSGKICIVCRKDVALVKRVKDPKGNYYCEPCYASRQAVKRAAQPAAAARVSVAPPPISRATVPPPLPMQEQATIPCPSCRAPLALGTVLCVGCGYNLRMGKKATTTFKKNIEWSGWLSLVPLEVWLTAGGIVLLPIICLAAKPMATDPTKVQTISFAIILMTIFVFGSRKCRRILVDEYGWSETLFRIPFIRNFVFLAGLFSAPKLWLITLRYAAAAFVFGVAGIAILAAFVRPDGGDRSATPIHTHAPVASHTADFAAPPEFSHTEPGIEKVELECDGPDHSTRELWIYRPTGQHSDHSLPCVFIAPPGTPMIYGAAVDSDQSPDHLSYAKAGFVVAAYSLDGAFDDTDGQTLKNAARAIKAFKASRGGIANAQHAIDYVLHNMPEVDPHRLYTAGGFSAGAVALDVAAAEPRISAVYAIAPDADAADRQNAESDLAQLQPSVPDIREFVRQVSPINHVNEMHCPIFIFQPGIDLFRTRAQVDAYCKALTDAGVNLKYYVGPSDLASIKAQDVPPGIEWLKALKGNPPPAATQKAPPQ
jgi:dienelactone hydrolase